LNYNSCSQINSLSKKANGYRLSIPKRYSLDDEDIGNCLAASAESAIHTSLGQRPRIMAGMNGRAEGPIHKSLWRGLSALKQ
jgi:hypothetical protein